MLGEILRFGEPDASFFSPPIRRRVGERRPFGLGTPLSPALSPLVPRGERGSLAEAGRIWALLMLSLNLHL